MFTGQLEIVQLTGRRLIISSDDFSESRGLSDQPAALTQLLHVFFFLPLLSLSNTLHIEMNLLGAEAWELQFSSQFKIAQRDIRGSAVDGVRLGMWTACMHVKI